MRRIVARLFFPLVLSVSSVALAAPAAMGAVAPPAPRIATPATPARTALANELVGYTQPTDLMLKAVLVGYEKGAAEEGLDAGAELDELVPGLSARLTERGKAELVALVAERIPQMHERLAIMFAGNCT